MDIGDGGHFMDRGEKRRWKCLAWYGGRTREPEGRAKPLPNSYKVSEVPIPAVKLGEHENAQFILCNLLDEDCAVNKQHATRSRDIARQSDGTQTSSSLHPHHLGIIANPP